VRQVILDEMGELMVHEFQLGFVNADDEGRQPDAWSSILLIEPEHASPHKFEKLPAGLIDRQTVAFGEIVQGFVSAAELTCQSGFLRRKYLLEDADLDPRGGAGKAVGKFIQGVCELFIN
jgi:hypothetical protein